MTPIPVLPPLEDQTLGPDPVAEFRAWYRTALEAELPGADAMTLATATKTGEVSARIVLLKAIDRDGFLFYTNYESRKGRELEGNASAALVFHWPELHRSVRVEGTVRRIPPADSDAYFLERPRDGQLSSLTSAQSEPVASREELDRRFEQLRNRYDGKSIPRPPYWGGYRLAPRRMEFWQHRFARLNDRILYRLQSDGSWTKSRLQP